MQHQPPCEELEQTRLDFAREVTALQRKKINWAVWAPVLGTVLAGLLTLVGSVLSAWASNLITQKATETAREVTRQKVLELMIGQEASFNNGVQVGRSQEHLEEEARRISNPPPLAPTIKAQSLLVTRGLKKP